MSSHGTPLLNTGNFAHFAANVITALPRDISADRAINWGRNREVLKKNLQEVLNPAPLKFYPLLTVRLGKYKSLSGYLRAIERAGMRSSIQGLTGHNFPISKVAENVDLVCVPTHMLVLGSGDEFKRTLQGYEVMELGKKLGLRPPRLEVALALRKAHGAQGRGSGFRFVSEDLAMPGVHYDCYIGNEWDGNVEPFVGIHPHDPKNNFINFRDWIFELPSTSKKE